MVDFIEIFLSMIFIPILVNVISNLVTDKIKTTLKFGDWKSGNYDSSKKKK